MKIHPTRAARPPGPPADAAVLAGLPQLGATIAARLAAVMNDFSVHAIGRR